MWNVSRTEVGPLDSLEIKISKNIGDKRDPVPLFFFQENGSNNPGIIHWWLFDRMRIIFRGSWRCVSWRFRVVAPRWCSHLWLIGPVGQKLRPWGHEVSNKSSWNPLWKKTWCTWHLPFPSIYSPNWTNVPMKKLGFCEVLSLWMHLAGVHWHLLPPNLLVPGRICRSLRKVKQVTSAFMPIVATAMGTIACW